MFVQFIEGQVTDPDRLRQQHERWVEELAPGAAGWLGVTAGVTGDGVGFVAARFESQEAARANSDRQEQGEWWAETEECFDGPAAFLDCDDVQLFMGGGSDDAGFVQVIRGQVNDVARAREMVASMDDGDVAQQRPDVIGGYAAMRDDGTFAQVVYFTSEEEAREGESATSERDEAEDWQSLFDGPPRFLDLEDPWLASASDS